MSKKIKVLFVCMGNICRSPTAEAVFRHLIDQESLSNKFDIESAGTHNYHVGEPADERSTAVASKRGFDMKQNIGRQVKKADLMKFDYIIAMDKQNYDNLKFISNSEFDQKISLFLNNAPELGLRDVPDPYFGGGDGFEKVLDIIEIGAKGFLQSLKNNDIV